MRQTRKYEIFIMVWVLFLLMMSPVLAQPKGGAMMAMDAFTPLAKGYDYIREGKYEAAKNEFAKAVKADRDNPFALNNIAVLEEREGKMNDALALLQRAGTHANDYFDKVTQTSFAGGGCLAVKPLREIGEKSSIAPIIQENIQKLEAKIGATGTPPPPTQGPIEPGPGGPVRGPE